jgi:hypothetical protein
MAKLRTEDEFKRLAAGFLLGRITRRRFLQQTAKLGISAMLLSRMRSSVFAASDDLEVTRDRERPAQQQVRFLD